MEDWNSLNPSQQQQLFMQQIMTLQPPVPVPVPPATQTPIIDPRIPQSVAPGAHISAPVPSSQQDPIQAFVAQMSTTQQSATVPVECTPSNGSPLEKLLCQLKKAPNPASSSPPVVPSNLIPAPSKPSAPVDFDPIKSFLNRHVNKMPVQGPDNVSHDVRLFFSYAS